MYTHALLNYVLFFYTIDNCTTKCGEGVYGCNSKNECM